MNLVKILKRKYFFKEKKGKKNVIFSKKKSKEKR
jgi:hypothetical protein